MKLTSITNPVALRRDTTVGTRIFAGDTMIHGDTGWRNVIGSLTEMVLHSAGGHFRFRRVGSLVAVEMRTTVNDDATNPRATLPPGFVPAGNYVLSTFTDSAGMPIRITTFTYLNEINFSRPNSSWSSTNRSISTQFQYTTNDPWPATLPGLPA